MVDQPQLRSSTPPTSPAAATRQAGCDALLQQGSWPESLAVRFEHDFLCLKAQRSGDHIHQLERTHGVSESKAAGGIDVFRADDLLFDQPDRLGDERVQHAIDREAGNILDFDRHFAAELAQAPGPLQGLGARVEGSYDLHEFHTGHRGEIVRANE